MALSSSGQYSGLSSRRRQGRNLQESSIKYDRRTRLRRVKQNGGMRVVEFIFLFACVAQLARASDSYPEGRGSTPTAGTIWRGGAMVACRPHKSKVVGSSPTPARDTKCYCHLHVVYLVFTNDRTKNFGCIRLMMQPKSPYNNGGDNNYGIYL